MDEQSLLTPGQQIRPIADSETAKELAEKLYGLKVIKVVELNAYDDKNFHIFSNDGIENPYITENSAHGYVLKVMNSLDSKDTTFVEAQNEMMIFLNGNGINCPLPVKSLDGLCYSVESIGGSSERYVVRLLVFRPGMLLHQVALTNELLLEIGRFTAKIDKTLEGFSHPAFHNRRSLWMLESVPKLRSFAYVIENVDRRNLVNEVIAKFEEEAIGNIDELEQGILHGDLNEQNIVINEAATMIAAVLDLGDSHVSCFVFELAVALCYMLIQAKDVGRGKFVLQGYQMVRKLTDLERDVLKVCVCARLCQSLVLGTYTYLNDPGNGYVLITQKSGWALLEELWPMSSQEVLQIWGVEDT